MIPMLGIVEFGISMWLATMGIFYAALGLAECSVMFTSMFIVCSAFGIAIVVISFVIASLWKLYSKLRRS